MTLVVSAARTAARASQSAAAPSSSRAARREFHRDLLPSRTPLTAGGAASTSQTLVPEPTSIPPTGDENLSRVTHMESAGHKLVWGRAKTMRPKLHRLSCSRTAENEQC